MNRRPKPTQAEESKITDKTFLKIIQELSNPDPKWKGRPISLDFKTYAQIIAKLEYGYSFEDVIMEGIITSPKFYRYRKSSPTFCSETDRARGTTTRHALYSAARGVRYVPAHNQTIRKVDGTTEQIAIPEKEPDSAMVRFWLSHEKEAKKRFNRVIAEGETPTDSPTLLSPATEREAELSLKVLNLHYDYVQSKRGSDNEQSAEDEE